MIDLKKLRAEPKLFKKAAKDKGLTVDIDQLLKLDQQILEIKQELDKLREEKNLLAKQGGADPEKGRTVKEMVKAKEGELKLLEPKLDELLLLVPNIPSKVSPVGEAKKNKVIDSWGEPKKFDFLIKDHIKLGQDLALIDFDRGVKIHGFRGYVLKNEAVLLQQAVLSLGLAKMRQRGFTLMIPPTLVKDFALYGSGHFPFGREEIFEIKNTETKEAKDRLYLAGTSEPSILAYQADQILAAEQLPLRYCAITPCYRSEVGSYGKDTKGLYRMHEFWKVEQVVICRNDLAESEEHFKVMEEVSREILRDLELPHQVVEIATGDMGVGKYRMHDLETWMPSRKGYGETHSNSNLTDWQARRLNIRYKTKTGAKEFVYTLNNTVIASPRILIPLLENHQQADGSILVPQALQPYCGFDRISPKK